MAINLNSFQTNAFYFVTSKHFEETLLYLCGKSRGTVIKIDLFFFVSVFFLIRCNVEIKMDASLLRASFILTGFVLRVGILRGCFHSIVLPQNSSRLQSVLIS